MENQEELFKPDNVKLPEGETDKLEPFESTDKLEYKRITPEAYDGEGNNHHLDEMGFLNLNKEHTGEEVANSIGMYQKKEMTIAEIVEFFKTHGYWLPMNSAPVDNPKAILAIDPGANGCLAVLNASGDVFSYKMPDTPKDLFDLLKTLKNEYSIEATLEKVGGMPGNGGSRMFNFGQGYGYIEMALIALEIKTVTVSSQAWQKTFLIGTKSKMSTTEWKNKLKAKAQQLYPHLRVTLGNADALLILEYAKNLKK